MSNLRLKYKHKLFAMKTLHHFGGMGGGASATSPYRKFALSIFLFDGCLERLSLAMSAQ
jgi:hypothetical protein